MAQTLTALLVDDEQPAIELLERMLHETNAFGRIFTANKPDDAIKMVHEHRPDVIFLDIEMPLLNGFELLNRFSPSGNVPQIVFVTAHSQYALQAIKAACLHYIVKPPDLQELRVVINRLNEKTFVDNQLRQMCLEKLNFFQINHTKFQQLTDREKTILKLLSNGKSNKEMGMLLNISALTVKTHRRNIYKKLNIKSPQELVTYVEVFCP